MQRAAAPGTAKRGIPFERNPAPGNGEVPESLGAVGLPAGMLAAVVTALVVALPVVALPVVAAHDVGIIG